ncbi:hypothetical protein CKAH01_07254 [Colletotrichum kahawae]|uniref:Uncharacterized protein n=1 Tax=Colletotrichum kahawae TaxID=34407 RepID=A0AAD9Y5Y1_COLKA|nr:hypothetical protein CKAH01_07254 [Colletotrichum kahawae]
MPQLILHIKRPPASHPPAVPRSNRGPPPRPRSQNLPVPQTADRRPHPIHREHGRVHTS